MHKRLNAPIVDEHMSIYSRTKSHQQNTNKNTHDRQGTLFCFDVVVFNQFVLDMLNNFEVEEIVTLDISISVRDNVEDIKIG